MAVCGTERHSLQHSLDYSSVRNRASWLQHRSPSVHLIKESRSQKHPENHLRDSRQTAPEEKAWCCAGLGFRCSAACGYG